MTKVEGERLAAVEAHMETIQDDITEIKSDVKSIVAAQQAAVLAIATRDATDEAIRGARAQNGVWVRWGLPVLLTGLNVMLAFASWLGDFLLATRAN